MSGEGDYGVWGKPVGSEGCDLYPVGGVISELIGDGSDGGSLPAFLDDGLGVSGDQLCK